MGLTRPRLSQIMSATSDFKDEIIVLNEKADGVNVKDIGVIFNRGNSGNVGFIWDESEDEFAVIGTTEDGTTVGNVLVGEYSNFKAGTINAVDSLKVGTMTYPIADGTNGQVLTTNGNGLLSWQTVSGTSTEFTVDTGWEDLTASLASAGVPSNNAPIMANFGPTHTLQRKEYKFAINDYLFVQPFHIRHDIKPNGSAFVHVHWSTSGTDTATVKWEFTLQRALGHQQAAFGTPITITVEQAATGTAWTHMVAECDVSDAITLTEPDELILVTLRRIANGTFDNANDVFGLTVDFHYETDRHATPNKSPNFYL